MVLRGYGDQRPFEDISARVERNEDGGTLGVHIGRAALALGYGATIYSYNLRVFDPSWSSLSTARLVDKLEARAARIQGQKLRHVIEAYADFLKAGGVVQFDDLTTELLTRLLRTRRPIVCGLSATYLYQTSREDPRTNSFDDVGGEPAGHFLVIRGYHGHGKEFLVSDPYKNLPMTASGTYEVDAQRLLNAILLGDVTYDGVLLVVDPMRKP